MQSAFYDVNLRTRLNASNNNPINNNNGDFGIENVVLNQQFSKWEDLVVHNLNPKNDINDRTYSSADDSALLKEAKDHIRAYNKPVEAENAIVLTHPLYLHLSHMNMFKTDLMRTQADDYLNKLLLLFEINLPREKTGIVVLDSLHYYAAATSLLLESGAIDHVIITEAQSGEPLDERDLKLLSGKRIFVGGGYNGRCLSISNEYVGRKARAHDFWAIHDLIINNPSDRSKSIRPSIFSIGSGWVDNFSPFNVISLEETLKKIGCSDYSRSN